MVGIFGANKAISSCSVFSCYYGQGATKNVQGANDTLTPLI